jgi:hypothetical protein
MKTVFCYSIAFLLVTATSPLYALSDTKVNDLNSLQIFNSQVKASSSVGNAVRSFIARYPEETMTVVEIALDQYPDNYRQVLSAAISVQPSHVDDILELAINRELAQTTELLKLAINAEPSYAEYAAEAACKFSPEQFDDILKTAVLLEPDSADQIAQKLAASYPNKALDILVTTIKEVPLVGKYVVDALLAIFPKDSVESDSMIIISIEQLAKHPEALSRLVQLAQERDIDRDLVVGSAIEGGLDSEVAVAFVDEWYTLSN